METIVKIIVSSKKNLQAKYGNKFPAIEKLLSDLITADKKRNIDTSIVYIDDSASAKKAGIKAVTSITRRSAKTAVDDLYKKLQPAYMVLFGAQDIIPFQEITNPAQDDDDTIPSDLPYACNEAYSNKISSFTGPARVVGRIPDIPGKGDMDYLKIVFKNIISYKQVKAGKLMNYFSVTAAVWEKSTQQSLISIFGNCTKLKNSPPAVSGYPAAELKRLTHFYNCHGSPIDSKYYGQKGNNYPTALDAPELNGKISAGAIVAAECCYGIQLYNPDDSDNNELSIANAYFKNKAIAMAGSSTIAYGPADSQGLADLITQYFIKNVIAGASTGRAMLEARQKFLSVSGPQLDPYELKTLAQFYLLGDPSIEPVLKDPNDSGAETNKNRRLNLLNKGLNLSATVVPSERVDFVKSGVKAGISDELEKIFKQAGFTGQEEELRYAVKPKISKNSALAKGMMGTDEVMFRAFIKRPENINKKLNTFDVLVLKECGGTLLGWKIYHRK
jgi:hypothetical protein